MEKRQGVQTERLQVRVVEDIRAPLQSLAVTVVPRFCTEAGHLLALVRRDRQSDESVVGDSGLSGASFKYEGTRRPRVTPSAMRSCTCASYPWRIFPETLRQRCVRNPSPDVFTRVTRVLKPSATFSCNCVDHFQAR